MDWSDVRSLDYLIQFLSKVEELVEQERREEIEVADVGVDVEINPDKDSQPQWVIGHYRDLVGYELVDGEQRSVRAASRAAAGTDLVITGITEEGRTLLEEWNNLSNADKKEIREIEHQKELSVLIDLIKEKASGGQ